MARPHLIIALLALPAALSALTGCDEVVRVLEGDAEVDGAFPDAGPDGDAEPDAGPDAGPEPEPPPEPDPCGQALHPDPDRPRVAVVGFPFSDEVGVDGTEIGVFVLGEDGLAAEGLRLDVMTRPKRVRFLPGGSHVIVLGEDGVVHTVRVEGEGAPVIVDSLAIDGDGWTDLVVDPDGQFAHAVASNVTEDEGVFTLAIGCEGTLDVMPEHLGLRLASTLALMPGDPDRAILLGGQAVFDPIDDDDTRLIERDADGVWQQIGAFDLWGDFVDAAGIGVHPDGTSALVPNGSPISEEGGQVMVVSIDGDTLADAGRIPGMDDARSAYFHHGGTALVSRLEPGRVSVLVREGQGYAVVDELRYGLPEDFAIVQRGALDGYVVLPAVSPATGSQLVTLRVVGEGAVEEVAVIALPAGGGFIPGTVAVSP